MYRAHRASPTRTDLRSFPGRTHWLIARDGWEDVAQACLDWTESLGPATVPDPALAGPAKTSLAAGARDSARPRAVPGEPIVERSTRHGEGSFDGAGGARLYCQWWRPDPGAPRAAVIAVHGFGAHSDLLAPLGVFLATRGFACYGMDLRGHGRSAGRRGDVRAWRELRDDLDALRRLVAAREGGVPLFLLGASAGALVVLDYALVQPMPPDLRGVIVQAPPLGRLGVSPARQVLARALARVWPTCAVPLGQDLAAVSRDAAVVRELRADPRLLTKATARFGVALLDAVERVNAGAAALAVPLLILHGTADRLAAPDGSRRFYARVAYPDKELREYDGGYHDLFRDADAARVLADLDVWLGRHVAPHPPERLVVRPPSPVGLPGPR
jgi:alpha-beta hydrolase superfamily lysophospholipase